MEQTTRISLTARGHYDKDKTAELRARITRVEPGVTISFRVSKRALAAARVRAGLVKGDYFDKFSAENYAVMWATIADHNGDLYGAAEFKTEQTR